MEVPTATTPRVLRGKVAVAKDSGVKPLGYICWFSVPDEDVSLRRVKNKWGMAGLDIGVLPKDPRAVDAFKRAVRNQQGIRRDAQAGTVTETVVHDVLENADDVIYQLTRVVRDEAEQVVEYPKAMKVWYSKVTGELDFRPLKEERPELRIKKVDLLPIMDAIQFDFEQASKKITGAKVRTLVRQYIRETSDEQSGVVGLSGENLRGKAGGVYFVLARYEEQLESLSEFLDELYTPGRAYMHMVPLADGASERELIRRHHTTNCVTEMEAAIGEVRDLLTADRTSPGTRAIRSNVAQHHWNKLQQFRRRAAEYANVLTEEQEELNAHMELLNRQLQKLV